MKLIQVAHAVTQDDAASRHMLNQDHILREIGYDTALYAHKVDPRLADMVQEMTSFSAGADDILIYHMTTGTSFNRWVYNYPDKIVLYYHNITPAHFFFGNAWGSWWKCIKGRRDLKKIVSHSFFGWAASEYSRSELETLGLTHTSVLPVIVDPDRYRQYAVVPELWEKYHDGRLNLLVVGRGVPHKKQDEAIAAIRWYREHISPEVRLIIIGGIKPSYAKKLHGMVRAGHMEDHVLFAGQISNEELCTWYRLADGVLCLSEHEGFCVPLVEGMIFDKPIFAYSCSAVPETLGDAGVLFSSKEPALIAQTIYDTLHNPAEMERMRQGRAERLAFLSPERIRQQVVRDMETIIGLWREGGH